MVVKKNRTLGPRGLSSNSTRETEIGVREKNSKSVPVKQEKSPWNNLIKSFENCFFYLNCLWQYAKKANSWGDSAREKKPVYLQNFVREIIISAHLKNGGTQKKCPWNNFSICEEN